MSPTCLPAGDQDWADPWPLYARLRDDDPVLHVVPEECPKDDYYVLSRYDDVLRAALDTATFSSRQGLTVGYGELEQIGMAHSPPLVMLDPPDHTAFRKLVSRGFTPRAVREVEPAVRRFVRDRLARLVRAGGGDIAETLFKPMPSMVVAHYLGVPDDDRDQFDGWTEAIVAAGAAGAASHAHDAVVSMLGYFGDLIERRRTEPGQDTVSLLVAADVEPLPILAYVFTMITGGNDTTTGLLGGGLPLLAQCPDQRVALTARAPEGVADAVEELLRLTSPVQGLARTTTRDVRLHDVTIPAGRKVLLSYAAANRDPRQFGPDAESLDVRRKPARILSFSHGSHHCLGAAAARMQARVALEEILATMPDFELDLDGITWAPGRYVRRPLTLPIMLDSTTHG